MKLLESSWLGRTDGGSIDITYHFERRTAPTRSAAVEWMTAAGWMLRFAPLSVFSTPIAESAGAVSALLRTSPVRVARSPVPGQSNDLQLRAVTLPDGSQLVRSYDDKGHLAEVKYPDGHVQRFSDLGATAIGPTGTYYRMVGKRDAAARVVTVEYTLTPLPPMSLCYEWSREGLLRTVKFPDRVEVQYVWDPRGGLKEASAGSARICYEYARSRRLVKLTGFDGAYSFSLGLGDRTKSVAEWEAPSGDRAQVVCPLGLCWLDGVGRVASVLRWDGNRIVFGYDGAGKLARVVTASGVTFLVRSASGEPASLIQASGTRQYWHRSAGSGSAFIVGPTGVVLVRHDARGRLAEIRNVAGRSMRCEYGRFSTFRLPRAIRHTHRGRLELTYFADGRPKKAVLAGKGTCSFRYSGEGRLNGLRTEGPGHSLLETARVAGWLYALSSAGPAALEDALGWGHLVL